MNAIIKPYSNEIANNLISLPDTEGRKKVFCDPITMMIISTVINLSIQFLVPYLKKKFKERADAIKNGTAQPSIFTRWAINRAIKRAEYKTRNSLNTYGITTKDVADQIFTTISNLDNNEIQELLNIEMTEI